MRTLFLLAVSLLLLNQAGRAAQPSTTYSVPNITIPSANAYTIVSNDANSRVWEKTEYEQAPDGTMVPKKHSYTELASGLNHLVNGQWVPSKEEIDLLPNGGAAATNGQHQVYFPADIYEGVIRVVTPDGKQMQSRPLGIYYEDDSGTVLIGQLTNSIGVQVSSNQVIYPNAFTGLNADIRYTYTKGGFEQDIILEDQPPSPEAFGLDAATVRLQVMTEFFNTTNPVQKVSTARSVDGLKDTTLEFGDMKMIRGKAFSMGDEKSSRMGGASVYKSWLQYQGRKFLLEELPVVSVANDLSQLPVTQTASIKPGSMLNVVSGKRLLPEHIVKNNPQSQPAMQVAMAGTMSKGLVLDYTTIDGSGYLTSYAFESGATYYISGFVYAQNNDETNYIAIQGEAVIKFAAGAGFDFIEPVDCETTPDNPAIMTAVDDNTVGETISGSTGTPIGTYADVALAIEAGPAANPLQNLKILYANNGIYAGANTNLFNCQFINVNTAIAPSGDLEVGNVLMDHVGRGFYNYSSTKINAAFVTAHDVNILNSNIVLCITNSLFICVTNLGTSFTSAYNKTNSSDSGVFESAANANDYLAASSSYRDIGTTSVDPNILSQIQTMTTYALQDGGYVDSDTPDLGYHYSVNEDSDFDGLPDWWELKYLGSYSYSGTNIDDGGNTLLYDYQNGINPNKLYLSYFPFDNTNTWVGSAGQLPLKTTNVVGVPCWNTNAVWIDSNNAAILAYRDTETNGKININLRKGTMRFWFKPDWASTNNGGWGPTNEGRLIEVGTKGTTSGWWGLVINPVGTNIYFGTQTNSTSTLTTNLTAPISWTSNIWHQVVLTYSTNNSGIYVDGLAVVTNGLGISYYPGLSTRTNGFSIGSSLTGTNQARGTFDELELFNYPLDAGTIFTNYQTTILLDKNGDGVPDIVGGELGTLQSELGLNVLKVIITRPRSGGNMP